MNEIAEFLKRTPPFREMDAGVVETLATGIGRETYEPDRVILRQSGEPASSLYVVRTGTLDMLDEGRVVDHLGEGEIFGISALSGLGPALTVKARTRAECYLIQPERARELLGTAAGIAFLSAVASRWRERASFERHLRNVGTGGALFERIRRSGDAEELGATTAELPAAIAELLDHHTDPIDIGHVVGATIDELTMRLIELHTEDVGDPPVAFSWLALGSAARHEQALNTDQDHALSFDADPGTEADVDPWFARLAEVVTAGLETCGIPRCSGGVMAVNPAWRRTPEAWRRRFSEYVGDASIMGSRVTGIAFDYRRVAGILQIERSLDASIREAREDRAFMARLATTVLEARPPTSRRKPIVVERGGEHGGTFNVKHGGITPITNLARFFAIDAGLTENRTVERLRGAAVTGRISEPLREDLEEAFGLLWRIRLEHHVMQKEAGRQPDDQVDPDSLRPMARAALGEALRIVDEAQTALAKEFRVR